MLPPKSLLVLLKAIALHGVYQSVDVTSDDVLAIFGGAATDAAAAAKFVSALETLIATAAREDWTPAEVTARCATSGAEMDDVARETVAAWWRDNRVAIRSHLQARARHEPHVTGVEWKVSTVTATGAAAQFDPEPSVLLRFAVATPGAAGEAESFGVEADRTALAALLRGIRAVQSSAGVA